jgi:Magnesium chelatase, subunit ChlI
MWWNRITVVSNAVCILGWDLGRFLRRSFGPPVPGKSRLARRLTTVLPEMTLAKAIETTRIHRVAGLAGDRMALVTRRPCRAPVILEFRLALQYIFLDIGSHASIEKGTFTTPCSLNLLFLK